MQTGERGDAVAVPGAVAVTDVVEEGVDVDHAGRRVVGHLARPADARGGSPGLLVLHEAFGLNDHIRDLTRRFAGAGFVAFAPDLYARTGIPDPSDLAAVMAAMFGLPDREVVADLDAASSLLRARVDSAGTVSVVGFCSGGRQALLYAACGGEVEGSGVDAVADCWGGFVLRATPDEVVTPSRPTPVVELAGRVRCPALLVVGEEDTNPSPAEVEQLADAIRGGGTDPVVSVFADAGHAFLADYRPTYREQAAHTLWPQLVAFLRVKGA